MKTDFSDYVSNKILFQLSEKRFLYSIMFFFKNLNPIECN